MIKIHYLINPLLFFIMLTGISCSNNKEIQLKGDATLVNIKEHPVSIDLIEIDNQFETRDVALYRETKKGLESVPFQIDDNDLWFLHRGITAEYYIKKGTFENTVNEASTGKKDGNLVMSIKGRPLLNYRYGISYPPNGVDSIFRKSGFIHPLLAPNGDTLTRIHPPDHFHHYGIWGPWTHTQINGQQVDFWNLGDGEGTVLFKELIDTKSGGVFTSINVSQEHMDLITENKPQVALNEDLEVKLWDLDRPDRYIFDYKTTFNTPLENGILFEAYRYGGGIGMRFTERWHKDNCTILTSDGKDRLTADGTNARWCIVKGESADGNGTNGILFMSHSKNKSHPEPMRIWPIDANDGRGDMFFEFCPIRLEEWNIDTNKKYELKYRMVVFEGDLNANEAEDYWRAFVKAPKMSLIKD